ncbi:MAG: hypothetical protein AB8G96_04110 [Phycisphaerales bacterium]
MSRDELLEMAPADALGLLDEYDALLFSRGFHSASESVRREIIELQAAVAGDDLLLTDVDPRPRLRASVIDRVSEAAAEAANLAPLATIGRPPAVHSMDRPALAAPMAIQAPARRSSFADHFWRAAVFALTASLIVTMYVGNQILDRNRDLTAIATNLIGEREFEQAASEVGVSYRAMASDKSVVRRVMLDPTSSGTPGFGESVGRILIPADGGTALFLAEGISDEDLRLVVHDASGVEIDAFDVQVGQLLASARFDIPADIVQTCSITLVSASGTILLST